MYVRNDPATSAENAKLAVKQSRTAETMADV